MKLKRISDQRKIGLFCSVLSLFLLFIACGGSDNQTGTDESASGTIQLQLSWRDNPREAVDCAAVGISTVMVEVYDENNVFLKRGGPWNCEDHTGDVTGIKSGPNRTVVVLGNDGSSQTVVRGEATGVTVGSSVEEVQVDLVSYLPTLSSPVAGQAVVNGACQFEWLSVEGAAQYQIQVSSDSGFNTTVIDELVASTTYQPTESLPVGMGYWRIKSRDRFGKESGWSSVESFNVTQGYTVTFSAAANGSLSGDTTQVVSHGGDCTGVTANPDLGYHFTGWSGGVTSTNNPLTVTNVTSDMTIQANFAINQYTVSFSAAANGTISGDANQQIEHGGTTTAVEAVPSPNYRFVGWTGDYTGTDNPLTLTNVTSDMNIGANFELITYFWITDTTPADSASDVRIDTNIQIVFNLTIDPATITGTTISSGNTTYSFTSSWHAGTNTLTLDPDSDLPAQSDIVVELPSTVTGYSGEVFTGDMSFTFRTGTLWHDGNTIFVSPSGLTGHLGTKADPLRSIQEAVDTAYAQGYLQVYVQDGTYSFSDGGLEPSGTSCLHITEPITIIGGWNPTFTAYSSVNSVLDGESSCDHVVFIQSSNVGLQYLEITGGLADGASVPHAYGGGLLLYSDVQQSNITIQDVDIDSNTANDAGGGAYLYWYNRDVTFLNCTVSNNTAPLYTGAGIRDVGSTNLTLDNVNVTDNSSEGISTIYTNNLTIQNSYFSANGTYAIYMWGGAYTTIDNTYISSDNVGIYLNSNANTADPFPNLSISNCTFSSSTMNSTTATPVLEGQSDVHDHALTGNRFLPNWLANLYQDWDGAIITDDAAGLAIINTAGHASHDANPAQDNTLAY